LAVAPTIIAWLAAGTTDRFPAAGEDGTAPVVHRGSEEELLALVAARGGREDLILLLDEARLAGDRGADLVARLKRSAPHVLTVLLGDGLPFPELVRLYRAGLFDAVAPTLPREQWQEVLARAGAVLRERRQRLEIQRQQEETTRALRRHQQRLQQQLQRTTADLAASHDRLAAVNFELTRHMDQLSLLYSFGRELSRARNWDATLEKMLGNLARFVGAAGAALVLRPAPDAPFAPRRVYPASDPAWERALDRLERARHEAGDDGDGLLVLRIPRAPGEEGELPVTALPLHHAGHCLGYLLLLDHAGGDPAAGMASFLRTVQMILAEEVAAAQTLDRLRELGLFNARVLETVHSGIWVLDDELRTIFCNRTARQLLTGRSVAPRLDSEPAFTIGRGRLADAVPGLLATTSADEGEEIPELLLDGRLRIEVPGTTTAALLRREAGNGYVGEGRIDRGDGRLVPVLVQASVMPGRRPDERWLVLVLEDLTVTHRLAAERQRADSLQSLVEMTATLAHEIRNPLTGLSAQAELLAEQLPAGDGRKRYLDVIIAEVERMNETITRMLQFTRPYTPQRRPTDLGELIEDCLALAEPRARQQGVVCRWRDRRPARTVLDVDGPQLKQVLLNLLHNAVDASPRGGNVEIELDTEAECELPDPYTGLSRRASAVRITVRDQGPGFGETEIETLFRPFFTTKSTGTGLGLSISRKIVTAHGGALSAGRRDGCTEFTLLLPRQQTGSHNDKELSTSCRNGS